MDKHSLRDMEEFIQNLEDKERYAIDNRNGEAILIVFPIRESSKNSDRILFEEIIHRLKILGIVQIDESKVSQCVMEKNGHPESVGKWLDGKKENAVIHINITDDRMKAYMNISSPKSGGKVPEKNDIIEVLYQKEIKFGIKEKIIDDWFDKNVFNHDVLIAQGELPVAGENGRIHLLFLEENQRNVKEKNGKIDHREIGVIKSVEKGQIIARKIKPEPGKDGKKVTGEIIPSEPGKAIDFKTGNNVKIQGDELIAEITGRPIVDKHGIISVDEIVYLDQVDYSTGNIDFPGSIIVEKRIADGFRLTTKGSILVKKSVGKVFLKAAGDIIIEGGFLGKDEGVIESESDVHVRFVERGRIQAKGSIYVKDAAMHSDLIAGESIFLDTGRGDLIGGEAISGENIVVNKLGAIVETKTKLIAGIQYEIIQMVKEIKNIIAEHEEVLRKIDNTYHQLEEKKKKTKEKLSEEENAMFEKLEPVKKKYISLLSSSQKQYETTLDNFRSSPGTYVLMIKEMYHGVEINFGQGKFYKSPLKPVTGKIYIYRDSENQIVTGSVPPQIHEENPSLN